MMYAVEEKLFGSRFKQSCYLNADIMEKLGWWHEGDRESESEGSLVLNWYRLKLPNLETKLKVGRTKLREVSFFLIVGKVFIFIP